MYSHKCVLVVVMSYIGRSGILHGKKNHQTHQLRGQRSQQRPSDRRPSEGVVLGKLSSDFC